MSDEITVFDRTAVRAHRDRAATRADTRAATKGAGRAEGPDFLFHEVAARLGERLGEVRRRFPMALELGCRDGALSRALAGSGAVGTLVRADLSPAFAAFAAGARAGAGDRAGEGGKVGGAPGPALAADEEHLPFAPEVFDLVVSNLSLHWVNDLPGTLIQIRRALRPDGLFLAAMFGGGTLRELRQALTEAEIETAGGAGPRVSPFADIRALGGLLQRAEFALPMVDRDEIIVTYENALALMRDLSAMGEGNAVAARRKQFSRRDTLMRAAAIYGERFAGADGRVPATFEIHYLTAWAPAASQPQPLRPGTATTRLADALGAEEISAGEAADPTQRKP